MAAETQELRTFGTVLHPLLIEAHKNDKREELWGIRYPYFRAVSIITDDGNRHSAFCRDISSTGMGLLHTIDICQRDVDVTIKTDSGYTIKVRTRIVWSQPCGDGWQISGGIFMSIPTVGDH